jgi:hypothetical protein
MSDAIETAAAALRESITRAIFPLQTTRVFSADAFAAMDQNARVLVDLLKGHALVSKRLLNEYWLLMHILRNEAPYFKAEQQRLEALGETIEQYLHFILENKTVAEGRARASII